MLSVERFDYAGWEYTGMDLDEEEEDIAAEAEQNEEEAEEEEEEEVGIHLTLRPMQLISVVITVLIGLRFNPIMR